ncbi:MAG: response regulator, partial [Legionellaceae bacterium]|nr:response regulator [Legionellaceae bacterium]
MKKKILVVDDSTTARMLFAVCLKGYDDYELVQAGNWQDALKMAEDDTLSLIILDYNMPEKVGTEVAKMMREAGVTVPFALMSANTQQHVMDEIEALGFIH